MHAWLYAIVRWHAWLCFFLPRTRHAAYCRGDRWWSGTGRGRLLYVEVGSIARPSLVARGASPESPRRGFFSFTSLRPLAGCGVSLVRLLTLHSASSWRCYC